MNQAAAFENGQKARGRQQAEARMLPSQQCFEPDQTSRCQVNAWLVMQHKLVTNKRVTQADLQLLPLFKLGIERVRVILEATAASFLRFAHGDVGGLDHALGRSA